MAIIIPSKNIYEMENPKVRDNIIDNVSVEQTVVSPNNELEVVVYKGQLNLVGEEIETQKDKTYISVYNIENYHAVASGSLLIYKYIVMPEIKISKNVKNGYATKIFTGLRESSKESWVQISKTINEEIYQYVVENSLQETGLYYEENEYGGYFDFDTIKNYNGQKYLTSKNTTSSINNIKTSFLTQKAIDNIPDDGNFDSFFNDLEIAKIEYIEDYNLQTIVERISPTVTLNSNTYINIDNEQTNLGESLEFEEDEDFFVIKNLKLLVASTSFCCASIYPRPIPSEAINQWHNSKVVQINQNSLKIEITVYGDTIGIDLTNGSVTYGSGNKPHSLSGNELMQDSAKVGNTPLTEYLASNILSNYTIGKETATLLCDINDYYDEKGNKKINANGFVNYFPNMQVDEYASNGITITQSNGVFNIVGENTESGVQYIVANYISQDSILLDDGDYYLSYQIEGEENNRIWVGIDGQDADGNFITYKYREGTFNINKTNMSRITFFIYVNSGSYLNCKLKIMLNKGKQPKTWTPTDLPMLFRLHDTVRPMVYTPSGTDRPMSQHKDGSPKDFMVVSSNLFYDGSVMQEIKIQEI